MYFFPGILLSHHSLFQNPRFLSSSKVQVLHELPSAEDFFKTYVLTGTPVEPWLHITLVMTRNTQLIKTNIGNLVMLYFVGIYEKTLIKVDHCCEAQSFILTLKKRPSVLRDGCFFASAWDFVLLVFFSRALKVATKVIRGAFPAGRFQPAETLPDFAFLRRKCSHRRVWAPQSLSFKVHGQSTCTLQNVALIKGLLTIAFP